MLLEAIRDNPAFRRFVIGDVVFAQYTCPLRERAVGIWSHTDHLVHVVSGRKVWRTATSSWTAEPDQTFFFRKGAYLLEQDFTEDFCALVFFIPDAFLRDAAGDFPGRSRPLESSSVDVEPALRLKRDTALAAFLQSMAVYFSAEEDPPERLLRLKLRELILGLLASRENPALAAYLDSLRDGHAPSIRRIMEQSFCQNLPLEVFARMCHRSLSTFKREFQKCYGTSPGRWLTTRRLERAGALLQSANRSITEIMLECGFEDASHFSKAFRRQFGCTPREYRAAHLTRVT